MRTVRLRSWWRTRFEAAVDDSRWGQAFANSLVCQAVFRTAQLTRRSLDGDLSLVGRTLRRLRPPSTFEQIRALAEGSGLYRGLTQTTVAVGPDGWRASAVGRWYAQQIGAQSPATRTALCALVILVAALTRALLDFGSLSASRVALVTWLGIVGVSLLTCVIAVRRQAVRRHSAQ